ncbi:MAG: prepilin-type N-terminal cleavage/methylation domain-containing protein [Candidatus Schekmanbacteria bacterium]|nr:prepilin-type N-terminal cleavage/methylation domain-containing protein [Candidatus Schekmanbacteria bacterium]
MTGGGSHPAPKSRTPRPQAAGFSLVEIMVATAILGLLSVVIYTSLRIGVSSWQKGEEKVTEAQRVRAVVDLLRREIAGAYPYMVRADNRMTMAFEGGAHELSVVTTAGFVSSITPPVGMKAITILVSDDPVQNKRGLILREALPRAEEPFDADGMRTILLDTDVKEITFRYLFYDKGTTRRFQISDEEIWFNAWSGSAEKLEATDLPDVLASIGGAPDEESEGGAAPDEERLLKTFERYFRYRLPRAIEITLKMAGRDDSEITMSPIVVPIIGGMRLEYGR